MTEAAGIVGEFLSLKDGADADLLAMQCGDFYEFFADDAETVAAELDLKVSQKSSHGSSYPMAGVPLDELTPYLVALVERGYRVAVAEQFETENGHARAIERVVTPGTLLETTEAESRYLAAIVEAEDGYGLALVDVTTGQFHAAMIDGPDAAAALLSELYRFAPVELLPGPDLRADATLMDRLKERTDAMITLHDAEAFALGRARHRVKTQFGTETVDAVGLDDEPSIRAAGAALSYVEQSGAGVLASITRLQTHAGGYHVELDATTQRNLELTETMQGDRAGSLYETIDHTVTAAGGRLLRAWLARPRRDRGELERRQAAIAGLAESAMVREELRDLFDGASDLERLAARAASGSADARALRAAADTLDRLPRAADVIAGTDRLAESPLADVLSAPDREDVEALATELDEALVEDPPGTITQGGLIARGYDDDLDAVVADHEAALEWVDGLADRESSRHSITHLSVDRNATDGYYIQVGNSETDNVPEAYKQIKQLKNSTRYTIPELEEREREILRLEERRHEQERELFEALRERVADRSALLQDAGRALAAVDVYAGLARHAVRNDWTRPSLSDEGGLTIEAGRHPVVEQTTDFVPNDLYTDEDRRFLIVTGPNMSGKSTYMRQAALIVLLGQIGSFVPAAAARIGLVDGIYTRVGALDELAQGRSTFMVEMQELSNILHSATEESLVILDEVGRGTATYDGISIAWAASEYIANTVRSTTLFATHYHELTALGEELPQVANVHVAADESDGDVTFLRTVREGPTDRSYGIHVAELAGVPDPVVDRSRAVLERLREDKAIDVRGSGEAEPTQVVFDLSSGELHRQTQEMEPPRVATDGSHGRDGPEAEVLDALEGLDVTETTPVDLVGRVQEWQQKLNDR